MSRCFPRQRNRSKENRYEFEQEEHKETLLSPDFGTICAVSSHSVFKDPGKRKYFMPQGIKSWIEDLANICQLRHSNVTVLKGELTLQVVFIYGGYCEGQYGFWVMEYMAQGSLSNVLHNKYPLDLPAIDLNRSLFLENKRKGRNDTYIAR